MQIDHYNNKIDRSVERYGKWLFLERLPVAWGKETFTGADQPWQQMRITYIARSFYSAELVTHTDMYSYPVTIYEDNE